jgi:hypothetical protein
LEWWAELFELEASHLNAKQFSRCLRTRMVHAINRRQSFDPLALISAEKLRASMERMVLPVLRSLSPTVALFWFTAAARPSQTPMLKAPFSNEGLGGQLWGQLKRERPPPRQGKGEPWPPFRMAPSKARETPHVTFVEAFCTPLALAVTTLDSAVATDAKVREVVREVQGKNKISDAALGTLTARRLQEFHTVLAMMWSLAHSAADPMEFDLTVTSLEMLLAAELLFPKGLTLPATFPRDVLAFLMAPARPAFENPPRAIDLVEETKQPGSPNARAARTPAAEASDSNSESEEEFNPRRRRQGRRQPRSSMVEERPDKKLPAPPAESGSETDEGYR